jgi:hypothetical protein
VNRRLWVSVVGIVATLGAVSVLHPMPGQGSGGLLAGLAAAGKAVSLAAAQAAGQAAARLTWDVVGLLAVAALVSVLLVLRRGSKVERHGEPWKRVVELSQQGRSIASIAQVTRQSQDAVRIVLAPVAPERSRPHGNAFRSKAPPPSEATERRQGRRAR